MNYLVAVDDCFLDAPGGMGRVAWDIAMVLRERGHDIAMVSIDHRRGATRSSLQVEQGVPICRYVRPQVPAWHPRRAEKMIGAATVAVREHLGNRKWDIVHMHTPFTGVGALRAIGRGPRYVYTLHSPIVAEQEINWRTQGWVGRLKMLFGRAALQRLEHEALAPADVIHTLSQFSRGQVEHYHRLGQRVQIIPHWSRPEMRRTLDRAAARQKLGWPADEKVFFTIRRLGPRYGLDLAIKAVAPLLRTHHARFVLGGDGPWRGKLEALAQAHGVADRVAFLGRVSDEQLTLAYQAADLFLLPTLALECFGIIILEALACGCPVLSSDTCAIPELMRPILPEFIVPAGDLAALREKAEAFLTGRLAAPSPDKLMQFVSDGFSRAVVAPQFIKLLEGNRKTA